MKVKHYPRVSSKSQADSGDSVEYQEGRLKEDSEKKGDKVISIHTDSGKSASISDEKIKIHHSDGFVYAKIDIRKRVGMNQILDSLTEDDWEILKVTKWDRFSRNNIFSLLMFQYFKDHGKSIVAVDDSNDTLVRDILGVLGQKEIEKLKQRIKDVRQFRFEKGMMVGRSPFGYKTVMRDKKVTGFKINEKEAEVVRDCFEMTLKGFSYKEICSKHNLKPQQYYNIIKNKVYCGYVEFDGQIKEGIHERIISEELFNKVKEFRLSLK